VLARRNCVDPGEFARGDRARRGPIGGSTRFCSRADGGAPSRLGAECVRIARRMSHRLPLLNERAYATRACRYCPKLCRPACPVATVTGNDALSPWGILGGLDPLAQGGAPATSEALAPAFACSGCGHCEAHCELATPVMDTVREARSVARSRQLLPLAAQRALDALPDRERRANEAGRALSAGADAITTGVVLFPGCTMVATEPSRIEITRRAIEAVVGPVSVVADQCCGLSWLELGAVDEFRARAEALSARLESRTVVTLDAGCAHAMRVLAGPNPRAPREVLTLEEWLESRLEVLPHGALASMGPFAVHDACRLGRGLGVFDAPRAIVQRLTGAPALELAQRRSQSLCSGGGGGLPLTMPFAADAITDELASLVRDSGAAHVLTGCPTSKRRLARAGVSAFTLADLFCQLASD
jgi:Fe-S oxidoreductase